MASSKEKLAWDNYLTYFTIRSKLNWRQYAILKMRVAGMTYKKVADYFYLSSNRIKQIEDKTCAIIERNAQRIAKNHN